MIKKYISLLLSITTSFFIFANISANRFTFAQNHEPIEIVELRSEYEKHYDNGNGTVTAFINTVPLHYYDNGEWIEIDNTLIQDEAGNYVNKSNSMNVTLAPSTYVNSLNLDHNQQMVSVEYNGYSLSWDFVNQQMEYDVNFSINNTSIQASSISMNNNNDISNINLENSQLNEKATECVTKLESSVSYNSLYDNVDVDIDIKPASVKETIILNNPDTVPEQFTYYIKANGLNAELSEDNSVHFFNEYNEDIFKIPAPNMFDSSNLPRYNYDINVEIKEYEDGYIYTISPNREWILNDERIYPIMIDPIVETINGIFVTTMSEADASSCLSSDTVKIGGNRGDRYEALISGSFLPSNYNDSTVITDAKFYMTFCPHSYTGNIDVYSINQHGMPFWNSCGGDNGNSTYISTTNISIAYSATYAFDITKLIQYWINYNRTGGYIGDYVYGFKLKAKNSNSVDSNLFEGYSNTGLHAPYIKITYTNDSTYLLNYAPHKYNDISLSLNEQNEHDPSNTLYNFQNKMNCYAYALQVYNRYSSNYSLLPGEFGLSNSSLTHSYSSLRNYYNQPPSKYNFNYSSDRQKFIEERMKEDAQTLNFNISTAFNTQNEKFILPSNFNENSGRIIAMTTAMYFGDCEYHFYVRNGNGTCSNGHGGNCSMWSHKPSLTEITNKSFSDNTILCDANIAEYVEDNNNRVNYQGASYYIITKDVNVYNSWHGNKINTGSTPYRP